MSSLFMSYSRADAEPVRKLAAVLSAKGFASPFLDIDPESGIHAGEEWEPALYAALRSADVLLFMGTPDSVESRWCFAEVALAKALGTTVLPVLLRPGGKHPLLSGIQAIDLSGPGLDCTPLIDRLRRMPLAADASFAWDRSRPAFPGLQPYQPEDAGMFFGRHDESLELVKLLQSSRQRVAGRLIGVVGPSGAGKSSLVRAGLIRRLQRAGGWRVLAPIEPGSSPVKSLAMALSAALGGGREWSVQAIAGRLSSDPNGLAELADEVCARDSDGTPAASLLVVVDEAERLLDDASRDTGGELLRILRAATRGPTRVWVVMTLRSDFLGQLLLDTEPGSAFDATVLVQPLARSRIAEVIERPAQRAALTLEPGLVTRMVEDTGGGDAVPLLAYTLARLAADTGPRGRITSEAYAHIGGVAGALRAKADELHATHGDALIELLLKFVALTDNGELIRRRVPGGALDDAQRAVVDDLVNERLLASRDDQGDGTATLAVVHDTLMRQWPRLREEIERRRPDLQRRSDLERQAAAWMRGSGALLRDEALEEMLDWRRLQPAEEPDLAAVWRFLDASAASDADRRRAVGEAVAHRVLDGIPGDPELGVLVALAAIDDYGATPLSLDALSKALAVPARHATGLEWLDAIAWSRDGRHVAIGGDSRVVRICDSRSGARVADLATPTGRIRWLAWSPDAAQIAAGCEGELLLLDSKGPERVDRRAFSGQRDIRLAWTHDGRLVVAGAAGAGVAVISGDAQERIVGDERVRALDLSPDGDLLAVATKDDAIAILATITGRSVGCLPRRDYVSSVAWSPDSQMVALGTHDPYVHVVYVGEGGAPASSMAVAANVLSLAWRPGGEYVAAAVDDGTVVVWHAKTGSVVRVLDAGEDSVQRLAWSPDGDRLGGVSASGTLWLWNCALPRPARVIPCHERPTAIAWPRCAATPLVACADGSVRTSSGTTPYGTAFEQNHVPWATVMSESPSGRWLATADQNSIGLWELPEGDSLGWLFDTPQTVSLLWAAETRLLAVRRDGGLHALEVAQRSMQVTAEAARSPVDAAVCRNGELVSATIVGNTVRLWANPEAPRELAEHRGNVQAVAFSRAGDRLASGCVDGLVCIWRLDDGELLQRLEGRGDRAIERLAWSPDDERLAVASADSTVRLWDVELEREADAWPNSSFPCWAPDGRSVATTDGRGAIAVWDARDAVEHIPAIKASVSRGLTNAERVRYGLRPREASAS